MASNVSFQGGLKMNDSLVQLDKQALLQTIDEMQQIVEQLKQENEKLRSEIVDREALITDLNAFSHMVAHDLKNPLTALTGYSFLLKTRLRDTQDVTVLRFLEIIDQTSTRMASIIDGLMLLASVRQKNVEPQRLDMSKIIEEVECDLELLAYQYHAKIVKPLDWPVVMGHAPWIEEVWSNYISNGIKYGGTPPVIEIGSTPLPDGKIRFWVHDNGNGLSTEATSNLFGAYTHTDQADIISAEGHGIGLSIVERIIIRLGGEVGVESTNIPGEGCIFSFTLPLPPED